jgi:uncharacterized protein (TIGR02001 family)
MSNKIRFTSLVAALGTAVLATGVSAQTAAPAATPPADAKPADPYTLTANVGIFSQYIFRGLTQTAQDPAFQGGFDFAHESGFYLGTWGSNISWLHDGGTCERGCSLEWDLYGGWKHAFNDDWGMDVGVLFYYYPGRYVSGATNPDTTELYIAGNWKWVSLKFSDAVSNTFGVPGSHNSWYLDLSAAYPINEQWSAIAHVGRQEYGGNNNGVSNSVFNYTDWKLGATYTVNGYTFGAYWTDTDANRPAYTLAGKFIGASTGTVYVQKTF